MATETRRLAQLPGYDTAPDVYETRDLDDDATTQATQQTSPRASSQTSETSDDGVDDEDDEAYYGVSRRRLYPERARSRFGASSRGVETRGADLSDRVDGRRRGYHVRRREDGRYEDDEESLEARIARLRREIEECKVLAEKETEGAEESEADHMSSQADALSTVLAGIEIPAKGTPSHRARPNLASAPPTSGVPPDGGLSDEQALNKISVFDTRLAALETILGISSLDGASTTHNAAPLLPSLSLLDTQLATLTSATSLANLETAHSKIQALKLEARNLASLQSAAVGSGATTNGDISEFDENGSTTDGEPKLVPALHPDDMKQLQSLYTLLPNLQTLSPTVPALVNRLRSLKTLHAAAANVNSDLESIEQRQANMDKDLKSWRDGLEKVEKAVHDADQANGRNGAMVREWIDGLEKRMKALGR